MCIRDSSAGGGATLSSDAYSAVVYSMAGVRPGVSFARRGAAFRPVGVLSGGFLLRLPADLRARIGGEYTFSPGLGGATGLDSVLRKGLGSSWDLELAYSRSPGRSNVSFGLVSFR